MEQVRQTYVRVGTPMTDRQVMEVMGYQDTNAVRPKITYLIDHGQCQEVGSVWDPETKRNVRQVALGESEAAPFMSQTDQQLINAMSEIDDRAEALEQLGAAFIAYFQTGGRRRRVVAAAVKQLLDRLDHT